MFRRGSIFFSLVGIVLLVGLLAAGGYWLYQAGQAQGYALGMAAASSSLGAATGSPASPLVPGAYPGWMPYGPWHFGFFPAPFFGLLCLGGLALFFLFFIGGIFRPRHWYGHHGGWHGGPPPWGRDKETEPPQAGEEPVG